MNGKRLDPQMQAVLDAAALQADEFPPVHTLSVAEARRINREGFTKAWNRDLYPVARVEEREVAGPRGPVPVRLYDPGLGEAAPCLVYLHGGGWVICDLDSHDGVCRRLAVTGAVKVVSVAYRLAPEHRYPAPLEDCVAALRAVRDDAQAFGVDAGRLAVGGDSAGANLALASCLTLRDAGEVLPRTAVLIYGAYTMRTDGGSFDAFGDGPYLLSREDMRWFGARYVPDGFVPGGDPLIEPLHADLGGLPHLYVTAAEFDPLLDDSIDLVAKLRAGGYPHSFELWEGVVHACIHMTAAVDRAVVFLERIGRHLRAALAP